MSTPSRVLTPWLVALSCLGLSACSGAPEGDEDRQEVDATQQAIYYGTPSGVNFGIVELTRNGGPGPCTGYFISRRHIVTAAHCTDSYYTSQYYSVRIKTGYTTFTNLRDTARTDNWVLLQEYEAPGWSWSTQSAASDTAILTLPATTINVPPNSQLLRVSTAVPLLNQTHNIWGWGANAISATGPLLPRDLLFGDNVYVTSRSTGRFNATSSGSRLTCIGDSGGPATRYYNGYYIATGTHRGSLSDPRCAWPNEQMIWSDTSNKISWIESTLRLVYGSTYSCARYSSGSNAYMKCF